MFEKIGSFIASVGLVVASWFGYTPEPEKVPITQVTNLPAPESNYADEEETFGEFNPVGGQTYRLKTSIGTTDTTILLSSFKEPITGNNITMSTLNSDIAYATIDPQSSSRKEFISFTGVTQNSDGSATLTGVSRGLSFQYPFTASSTLRQAHPGQSILILSDSPQFFSEYTRKRSNEVITGQWTFSTFPITPSSSPASATTTGMVELATGLEAASSTQFGATGYRLGLSTLISTSSPSTAGNYVVVTKSSGFIGSEFFPSTTVQTYTATGTGTWNKPANLKFIRLQMWGGGGSGANSAAAGAELGGGGGGGYFDQILLASQVSSTVAYNVGGGGKGVVAGNGRAGSSTTFGPYIVFGGGGGGQGIGGGGGGTVATGTSLGVPGDTLASAGGQTATPTPAYGGGGGGGASEGGVASGGASTLWGGAGGGGADANGGPAVTLGGTSKFGGNGGNSSNGGPGLTGGSQPGGGGGAMRDNNTASGAGAPGQIIVTEFY